MRSTDEIYESLAYDSAPLLRVPLCICWAFLFIMLLFLELVFVFCLHFVLMHQ